MKNYTITLPARGYFALFAISGFAGLIYESIWTHYLKLFLGHAAYAQTLVLAIFMGGMALGSWVTGAYSARLKNLLRGYAIVEGLIGLAALAFHGLFVTATNYTYDAVLPGLASPAAAQAFKWGLASLFILPQSVLLGMTFPLMSGGILRRNPEAPGRALATLYFSNSIGAAAGVLASGFLLIGLVGLPGTMMTAGLMNLALALLVWLAAQGVEPAPAVAKPAPQPWRSDPWVRIMLVAAAVTGLASFLYEIAWIRMLSLVLGGSTHSFELMLAAFILGLALGGLYVRRRVDRLPDPTRFLAYVQLLMGGFALATIPVYGLSFEWMSYLLRALARTDQGYTAFVGASSAIALAVMLPATFCAGMTLPLLTYVLLGRGHGERTIGSVYAANTVGAIVGIVVAVHLLMPAVGVKGIVVIGATLDLALGVVLLARAASPRPRLALPGAAIAACVAVLVVAVGVQLDPRRLASGVYRTGGASLPQETEILFLRDGKTATISLVRTPRDARFISTNGKTDAKINARSDETSPDEMTMTLAGALPLALHPRAKTAANIGFGSGLTTHVLLSTRQLERVDSIEIERFMVEAARGFGDRVRNGYEDPRSHIHFEDAKTFFATRAARYDIIVSEPSNPWVSGVASLFSTEFYSRIRTHLNPDGIFVQWLQAYEIEMPLLASILKALDPHFSDYAIYGANDADLLIVARRDGKLPNLDEAVLADPGLAAELSRVMINGSQDVAARRIAGKRTIGRVLTTYPVPTNSDYFPFLDQNAARARFVDRDAARDLVRLKVGPLPIVEMLEGRPSTIRDTRVTRDEQFFGAALTHDAMKTRDAILGRGSWTAVPGDIERDFLVASLMLDRCDPNANWSQWRSAVRRVPGAMLARLTPHDGEQLVGRLRAHPCLARLPVRNRRWLDLLHAVAVRDAAGMETLASAMLDGGETEDRMYLVYTAMLGALARERPTEALAFWLKPGARLQGGAPLALDARVLIAGAQPDANRQARLGPAHVTGSAGTSLPQ